jgi:hypothetical protein
VPEVDTALQHLAHRDDGHGWSSFVRGGAARSVDTTAGRRSS